MTSSMKAALARYVLSLRDAATRTTRAEDRPVYEKYLADAGVLLALAEVDTAEAEMQDAVRSHERLWGHTWLIDEVYKKPATAWEAVKREVP